MKTRKKILLRANDIHSMVERDYIKCNIPPLKV